jgi:cytochrome c-type biogenesis protein CcsB
MSEYVEVLIMWLTVTVYAVSSVLFVVGLVFRRPRLVTVALWIGLAGLLPHTVAIAGRWMRVGHGPYLGFYEVVSSYSYMTVAAMFIMVRRFPGLRVAGVLIMPIAFLLLGGAMLAPQAGLEITPRLASWWLTIHVAFAKLSYGAFIAAMVLGLVLLFRDRVGGSLSRVVDRFPDSSAIDDLTFRFVAIGFIFLGIMIAAGAIWANEAWGRYWGWDPIETWSLISWLIYAAVMHARLTLGWKGRRFAWAAVAALPVILFALIGVPVVYSSIHGAYLTGY